LRDSSQQDEPRGAIVLKANPVGAKTVLADIDTLLLSGCPMTLGRKSILKPYTRVPAVMGAVLRNDQIAEKFYEYGDDLVRVTVTVAHKPPHKP